MLPGLTSPCATGTSVRLPECMSSSADATVSSIRSRSATGVRGFSTIHSLSVVPST
jgi:hypothetical protein